MKKINLFLITMLISTVLFAQKLAEKDVAVQVKNDLKNRFPAAEKAIWEKDNSIIKVAFINDGSKIEVAYQNNIWQQTKWIMDTKYVPQKIKDYIAQHHAKYKIKELSFVDKNNRERLYEVKIAKKKKDKMTLIFNTSNAFLRIAGEAKKENLKKQ